MSRKCSNLYVSQLYWPLRPVTGIALPFFIGVTYIKGSYSHAIEQVKNLLSDISQQIIFAGDGYPFP
jgi:hypothetical protein